jgi:hypothetical protein
MIFQLDIATLDTELSQLQALLDTKRQQRSLFEELDAETNAAIGMVALLKTKIEAVSSDAIASLKSAVLTLFESGDGGNGDGNQPIDPTPEPDDDEPELLCLNGLTGECLTTADLDQGLPIDDPISDEWILPSDAPLTGQTCAIDPELYWEVTPPDGSSGEFASPLACLLWEDAPMLGQHCTIILSPSAEEDKITLHPSSTEMVHTSARTGYLKLKASGQILASYAWFPRKDLAIAWLDWLDGMSLGSPELRPSKRNLSWKYEIKLTGLSMTQIERLSAEDLSRKPSKKKETPAQAAGIEPPSDWGMVQTVDTEIEAIASPTEPVDPIIPKLIESLKACTTYERYMELWQVCGVGTVSDAFNLLPREDKERIKALRPIKSQPTELIEFNDLVEVVADGNDTVGLVGSFGRVKVIKSDRVGVEIDEQLVYFLDRELKVKAKAEAPIEQQLQSGQVLTGNRVVTTGAYFGTARRNAASMARMGTHDKLAQLQLMKDMQAAGLSPELAMAAATGTDDASDF